MNFMVNPKKNMCLQIDLLLKGYPDYSRLFNAEVAIIKNHYSTTNTSVGANCVVPDTPTSKELTIKSMFHPKDKVLILVSGTHFNKITLSSPTKTKLNEIITG